MKKFIVSVLSICVFASCSNEDIVSPEKNGIVRPGFNPKNYESVQNPTNEFDFVGELYIELLDDYLENYEEEDQLKDIIINAEYTAENNTVFNSISSGYLQLEVNHVEWVLDNINTPVTTINATGLSATGKSSLSGFVNNLDNLGSMYFENAIKDIVIYENAVMANTVMTDNDRYTILRVTAITKYSLAYENDGGDRGWLRTKAGILASMSAISPPQAVTMSLVANIAS